jgi:hypothetical protein
MDKQLEKYVEEVMAQQKEQNKIFRKRWRLFGNSKL